MKTFATILITLLLGLQASAAQEFICHDDRSNYYSLIIEKDNVVSPQGLMQFKQFAQLIDLQTGEPKIYAGDDFVLEEIAKDFYVFVVLSEGEVFGCQSGALP